MSTITTTSTTALPEWYNQYAQNLLGRGYSVTSEGYQPYGAPRIAPFTQDQQQSFDMTRQNVGSYQPMFQQGAQAVGQSIEGSAAGMAAPMIQRGIGTFPENAQEYMNPYTDAVVSNIATLGARNLSENLLPQLNSTFIGGGTFGGGRNQEMTARTVRDANESIMRQQTDALRQGYNEAAGIFGQDQGRALTGANITGNLGVSDLYRQMQGGQTIAGLGRDLQSLQANDAASVAGIGQQQQNLAQTSADLAFRDFEEQRDFPWLQTQRLGAIGQGLQLPRSTTSTEPGPNQTAQNIGGILTGIGALGSFFGG